MKKIIFLAFVFTLLYSGARFLASWDKPNSDSEQRVSFEIKKGSSLNQIINLLDEKKLIRDKFVFKIFVKTKGLANKLQAGDYVIQKNLKPAELVDVLQAGRSEEMRITIPEGTTIKGIDRILAKKSLIEKGDFERCTNTCNLGFRISNLEGYLFPATYYVSVNGFSNKKFIQRLYNTFNTKISGLKKGIKNSGATLEEIVKVASMVEREAFGDNLEEKKMISAIIWNRLDIGMYLGIDATTRYEKDDWKGALYSKDFANKSPYNTRKVKGLPPTAISNPGLNSLTAAVYPKETNFLYYLHDSRGKVHFAQDLEGHVENKRKWLY